MKLSLLFKVLPLFLLLGCSASQTVSNDIKMEIKTRKMESWVNLMPGSKQSFFISGELIIESKESAFLDSVHLLKCEISQQSKLLYELHPDFQIVNINMDLVNADGRLVFINLSSGVPIKKELNLEKSISMEIYLTAINKVYHHRIDSVNVAKAY